jgi:hypothetical protein
MTKCNQKISVYIILYSDLGFLNNIISGIFDFVDEIILIDGPYSYNIDVFKKLELFYDNSNKPDELVKILLKYSAKIKYIYNIFENEEEKRIFGFEQCSHDIVLLVDCDEFFIINTNNINEFINSNKKVAGFSICNMNRININIDEKVTKNILFKKNLINSREHLDYTWLVGCKQRQPISENIYTDCPMGEIFHQTLNRSKKDNIIKYIFYISLYFYNQNNNKIVDVEDLKLIGGYTIDNLLDIMSIEETLDIFYHSKMELIGIPSSSEKILSINNNVSINLEKFKDNHISAFFKEDSLAVRYVPYYFYLPISMNRINEIEFIFENVTQIQISIYEINLNESYKITQDTYTFISNNLEIKYPFVKKPNYFSTLIMFNCIYTVDNMNKYYIKQINIT